MVGISTPPQLLQFKLSDLLICPVGFILLSGECRKILSYYSLDAVLDVKNYFLKSLLALFWCVKDEGCICCLFRISGVSFCCRREVGIANLSLKRKTLLNRKVAHT